MSLAQNITPYLKWPKKIMSRYKKDIFPDLKKILLCTMGSILAHTNQIYWNNFIFLITTPVFRIWKNLGSLLYKWHM